MSNQQCSRGLKVLFLNEAPAGTGRGPHGYRFTLPFAGPDKTTSAAAISTATRTFLSRDLLRINPTGSTSSSDPAGPPKVGAEELR